MQRKDLTLSISHSIFLTRRQRYSLYGGKKVLVIGGSLPVWFYKGTTSEPAEEVFCRYIITNKKAAASIKIGKTGYNINLPQFPDNYKEPELSNDKWREMSVEERNQWYRNNPYPLTANRLLDLKDKGSESMHFRINETRTLINSETGKSTDWAIKVVHLISIKDINLLLDSLTSNL